MLYEKTQLNIIIFSCDINKCKNIIKFQFETSLHIVELNLYLQLPLPITIEDESKHKQVFHTVNNLGS